jgi:hypothetical protein
MGRKVTLPPMVLGTHPKHGKQRKSLYPGTQGLADSKKNPKKRNKKTPPRQLESPFKSYKQAECYDSDSRAGVSKMPWARLRGMA